MIDAPSTANLCKSGELVLCLEFEANTDDSSMVSNVVTSSGVEYVPGRADMAARVDEMTSIEIEENVSLDLQTLTIEGWIHLSMDNDGMRQTILDNNNQYVFGVTSDGQLFCLVVLGGGENRTAQGGAIPVEPWTHVACTYDLLAGLRVHVNAEEAGSDPRPHGTLPNRGNIGSTVASDNLNLKFFGDIDTLRVWNSALSDAELQQIVDMQ